ncbi:MAG: hypothetical protein NTZ78_09785 [Candidatus Aureabacteria bacterium]|nr:hypothetical protein [Candidatus Auribacterota bacterium]
MRTTCEPRYCEHTPNGRAAAPTICWTRISGACRPAPGASWHWRLRDENQMGD